MLDAKVGEAVGARRAVENEVMILVVDEWGKVKPAALTKDGPGDSVCLVAGDVVAVDHVPAWMTTIRGIYEVDRAIVEGTKADILRFPDHGDVHFSLSQFAGNGVTLTLVQHAGAGPRIVGENYVYVDPDKTPPDPFGSAYEGC